MADVKWIKITTNIFDDEKIKIIDGMPEVADAIECIWFKLLVLAGKQNNDGVFILGERLVLTDDMLASIFHRPLQTVRLALKTFEELDMIEVYDGVYSIPNWSKYQNTDALDKIRESNKERQKRHRERIKADAKLVENALICDEKEMSHDSNRDSNVTDNVFCSISISNSNSNNISNNSNISNNKNININELYKIIIDYLNDVTGSSYKSRTAGTQKLIHARLEEGFTVDDFRLVIDHKNSEWAKDEHYRKYLRPQTLFGTKFESYLQEAKRSISDKIEKQNPVVPAEEELVGDDW